MAILLLFLLRIGITADTGHQKQAQRVAEITGREAQQWTPLLPQGKDLADLNAWQVAEIEAEQARQQEKLFEEQENEDLSDLRW